MTEYTMRGDKPITEITDWDIRNQYLRQAKELYQKGEAYDMTFLPIAEGFYDVLYPLVQSDYEHRSENDTKAYSYIMQKTLEETFKRGNPQHDSNLIIRMSIDDLTGRMKANVDEWRALTLRAIQEQMRQDPEWFGKLTPAAQLTAIGLEMQAMSRGSSPRLQYEEGLKFDFGHTDEDTYFADLTRAANMILPKAYRRNNEYAYPLEDSQFTWEVKAAALEAQLKSHGGSWKEKIPSLSVFVDLLKTAEKPAQQLKLAELAKEPDFKESMRYDGLRNDLRHAFKEVAPCGEATQKMFYEILYNFGLRGINEPKLQLGDINFSTLQTAVAECKAQRATDEVNNQVDLHYKEIARLDKKLKEERLSKQEKEFMEKQIDDLRKKDSITEIPDIDLVAKYRPEFLEQAAKMTPELCAEIMKKYAHKFPAQTQLEMMTKVVENMSITRHTDDADYIRIKDYIERAAELNTSSRAMQKFCKALKPVVGAVQERYEKDKSFLAAAQKAKTELREAESDKELFEGAREKFMDLWLIGHKIEKLYHDDDCKCVEPSKESVDTVWNELENGKVVKLNFEPKTGLGRLMMNKNAKRIEQEMQDMVAKFNSHLEEFALSSEFKYIKEVGYVSQSVDKKYIEALNQKEERITQIKREIGMNYYDYTSGEEKRIKAFEKYEIADKFAALETQVAQRSKDVGGRKFNRKPLEGLVKEEKMAQSIYKDKIAELRQVVKDEVKQDMVDRGVNEKPNLDNPNDAGKPMTKENTAKLRKNMKDLQQYKRLVKE